MLGAVAGVGAARSIDPGLWFRPVMLASGGPLIVLWWQLVVRPRHRWWALGAALLVTTVVYLLLSRLILVGLRLISALSRRVALRVDAAGVTLPLTPPWPSSRTAVVPWSDIEAVVLFTQHVGVASIPYVGLQRRPGLPPLPGSARSRFLRRMNHAVVPHVPPDVLADSRQATSWRLHRPRLKAAVRHFAPSVKIVDLD